MVIRGRDSQGPGSREENSEKYKVTGQKQEPAAQGRRRKREDESSSFSGAVAYAPAAIPRPGDRCVRAAMDEAARDERLLGHGETVRRVSEVSRDAEYGPVVVHATRRVCQRSV